MIDTGKSKKHKQNQKSQFSSISFMRLLPKRFSSGQEFLLPDLLKLEAMIKAHKVESMELESLYYKH